MKQKSVIRYEINVKVTLGAICPVVCIRLEKTVRVQFLQWTPEGRRLVTGASSGEFTLWNGLTFNFETILQV